MIRIRGFIGEVEWWSGGVVEWMEWMEWWSGGVVECWWEWWNSVVEWWSWWQWWSGGGGVHLVPLVARAFVLVLVLVLVPFP